MNKKKNNSICVICKEKLVSANLYLKCENCKKSYPFIDNEIPILIENASYHLTTAYFQYSGFIKESINEINRLKIEVEKKVPRKEILKKIITAKEHNLSFIISYRDRLREFTSIEEVSNFDGKKLQYMNNFNYLRRDWVWSKDGEKELTIIREQVNKYVKKYSMDNGSSLFLGAGTARLAWDFKGIFNEVYAVDNSFTMVNMFHDLLKEDLTFYEVNTKNVKKSSDFTKRLTASIKSPNKEIEKGNINYFVGDALNLALPDNSVSVVFSIYFTDVLPLNKLIKEIKRVLKPGGVLIHFGPLEYHFNKTEDMLASDEVKTLLKQHGLEVEEEKFVKLAHLNSKLYENWSFVATNLLDNDILELDFNFESTLILTDKVNYLIKGELSSNQNETELTELISTTGKVYEGASTVLDILRTIDGQKTVKQVIYDLGNKYNIEDKDIELTIFNTLKFLIQEKLLSILK